MKYGDPGRTTTYGTVGRGNEKKKKKRGGKEWRGQAKGEPRRHKGKRGGPHQIRTGQGRGPPGKANK